MRVRFRQQVFLRTIWFGEGVNGAGSLEGRMTEIAGMVLRRGGGVASRQHLRPRGCPCARRSLQVHMGDAGVSECGLGEVRCLERGRRRVAPWVCGD